MKLKKTLWIILGCVSLGLGAVGAVLPVLPSVPLLLLAAFCFARSSERLHKWFVGTKLYRQNLESFAKGQGMTRRAKLRIMLTVTLLMGFGFLMMLRRDLYIPCAILAGVWLLHVLYFTLGVKKYQPPQSDEPPLPSGAD
ncbi:MAG: YbaN family protein [Clostridia bacterium]|nr:YbaN family protein [Clostridia bacterium]